MHSTTDTIANAGGTSAHRPDLDWSQVRETILMLGLAITQIRDALTHGEESISTLTHAFTSLAGQMEMIRAEAERLPAGGEEEEIRTDLLDRTGAAASDVHAAIIAFQFYDRLAQRLDHVCHSINGLANLISEPQRLFNPTEWVGLQERIKSKYTMAEERVMFELIMQGVSIEDALNRSREAIQSAMKPEEDNFELF